jgi:MFS family permease
VLISVVVALSLLGDQLLYAVLPVMHEAMGIPVTAVGLILSANRLVRLVTNSLSGYVIDRFGRRWPFIGSLLLGGVTTIAYGALSGVWTFLIARLLWGTAWSFLRIEGLSTALDVATDDNRGRMMGIFQSISRLGGAIAMLAGGILTDTLGFRFTFILFGIVTCLAALIAYGEMARRGHSGVARSERPAPYPKTGRLRPKSAASHEMSTLGATQKTSYWRLIVISWCTFSTLLVIGGFVSSTLGYMLQQRFGMSMTVGSVTVGITSLTGMLLGSRGFLELVFAPLAGSLSDRWGRQRLVFGALPLGAFLVALYGFTLSFIALIAITFLVFLCSITLHISFNAVAGDVAPPEKRSMFLSLFVTFQDLGAALGPLLGYWIAPHFGLSRLYIAGAMILAIASLLYLITFRSARHDHS